MATALTGLTGLALIVLGLILAVAWIILPFALIGTKPLLRELIAEVRLLRQVQARQALHAIENIQGPNGP